jgi:hypothetical protein
MAKSRNNSLTKGLSGKLGGVVFRQRGDMVVMAAVPNKKKKPKFTDAQLAQHHRFRVVAGFNKKRIE